MKLEMMMNEDESKRKEEVQRGIQGIWRVPRVMREERHPASLRLKVELRIHGLRE
jgi:hypothetical protein